MVPRPDYKKRWSDAEHPKELDLLLKALGAEVIDFPLKTHCCGGHMTQIGPTTAFELIRRLLQSAEQFKADVMVTVCPMCQMNVDAYQGETNRHFHTNFKMPILFFTQLMGVAFGKDPAKLGFGREFVKATEAMRRIGIETPVELEPKAQPSEETDRAHAGMPDRLIRGMSHDDQSFRRSTGKERIGVYVCHCGTNIAGSSTWKMWPSGREKLKDRGVVVARDYKFMCSSLGKTDRKGYSGGGADPGGGGGLLAAPANTFRTPVAERLNPYLCGGLNP
jgi:hypothetical protein